MRLASALELKAAVVEHDLQALTASSARFVERVRATSTRAGPRVAGSARRGDPGTARMLSVAAGPVADLDPSQRTIAIGIARRSSGPQGYQLAVRVQRRALLEHPLLDSIRRRAANEVDVRFVGRLQKRLTNASQNLRTRLRPLIVGASVAHRAVTAGTLGAFVVDARGRTQILSNNHVLANEDRCSVGDAILQPGRLDGGRLPADEVARLGRRIRLSRRINRVDAALATLAPGIEVQGNHIPLSSRRHLTIAKVLDTLDVGLPVLKLGRTTGLRKGRITAIDLDYVVIAYDIGNLTFNGQIEIEGASRELAFSDGGDSGSLIVTPDGYAAGLLFAGGEAGGRWGTGLTYANPLAPVLQQLGVRLLD